MQEWLSELFRRIREQFPALDRENDGGYIFFDNAAGAQLPRQAIERVTDHLIRKNAQKGSIFARQERMQNAVYAMRAGCADLMGTRSDRVALGLNATTLTAMVAHHLRRDLKPGDLVLTSEFDHTANITPWEELREMGVQVEMVPVRGDGSTDLDAYQALLERRPKVVAFGWVSNATGTLADVAGLTRMAHEAGALVMVDAVAGAPHLPMAVEEWDVDFAVCSAYKIFGPHLGMLYVNPARLDGWKLGALISQDPGRYSLGTNFAARLELGTQNHEGITGFLGTLEYLEMVGGAAARFQRRAMPTTRREGIVSAFETIGLHEQELTQALLAAIGSIPDVTVYGTPAVPIVSFNIAGRKPADVARHLESRGIEARTGNYLAIPSMVKLAAGYEGEAVRVSLLHYNTTAEVARLAEALQSL